MIEEEEDFISKGVRNFWTSNGTDHKLIPPNFRKVLRALLVHLATATSLDDIKGGLGRSKGFKALVGHTNRYELQVNGNYRLTFNCDDPSTGRVTKIDLEDVHRKGGAKKH